MKQTTFLLCMFLSFAGMSQEPLFTIGSQRTMSAMGNPDAITFRIGTNNYVLFQKYKMSEGMLLHLEGFTDPTNGYLCSQDITTPHEPNEIAIFEGFAALSDKMFLFRSVFKKDEKKDILYAHLISEKGVIEAAGKEITSIVAEKAMNSGNFIIEASADGKSFVVLSEYPFVKETKEKFAVTVFDNALKQLWTKEIELQHDSRRGPVNEPVLSNSGIAYIIKKVEGPKNADFYTTYQISDKGAKVTEHVLEMEVPKKIVNYGYVVDEANSDLIVAGYYTEDGKVTIGGTGFKGTFTARVSGSNSELKAKCITAFEKTQSNLRVVKVMSIKAAAFLIGEVQYENNIATEQKDSKGFAIYNREFVANDIHVTVMDANGKTISTNILRKENKTIEDSGLGNSVAVAAVGEQVMLVYNDYQYRHDGQEHKVVGPGLANLRVPVIQFVGADGSMGVKFAMIDSNIGGKKGTVYLYPNVFVPITEKEFFFMSRGDAGTMHPIRMKLP